MAIDLAQNYGYGEYFVLEGERIVAFGFRNRWAAGAWVSYQPQPERLHTASRWNLRDRYPRSRKGQSALEQASQGAADLSQVQSFGPEVGQGGQG